jgi:hypothetical protein
VPFNSDTYHANKAARDARDELERARALKAKVAAGEHFYEWQRPLEEISRLVAAARLHASMSRMYRRHAAMKRGFRR